MRTVTKLHGLLDGWLKHAAYQVGPEDGPLSDMTRELLSESLFMLRMQEAMTWMTMWLWHKDGAACNDKFEANMDFWEEKIIAVDERIALLKSQLNADQLKLMGFTDQMWWWLFH
jgi:hypothetical protein